MNSPDAFEVANLSDVGCKRLHNEDSTASDAVLGIFVLADGMGGYKSGEVASSIAVASIYTLVLSGLKAAANGGRRRAPGELLRDAVSQANLTIYNAAQNDAQCRGMGTTIVTVLTHGDRFSVAHVGDSRLYKFRNNMLNQITKDHSFIQELVDRGIFSLEEALKHAPKNLVTKALGLEVNVEIDMTEERFDPGDILLLCSDGLTDMVEDEEIRLTISKYSANLMDAAKKLVELAKMYGGKDNISVILAGSKTA